MVKYGTVWYSMVKYAKVWQSMDFAICSYHTKNHILPYFLCVAVASWILRTVECQDFDTYDLVDSSRNHCHLAGWLVLHHGKWRFPKLVL